MFLWNMSLETGIEEVDHGRKRLLGAMADFFQIMDDPNLNHQLLAERTGAIFNTMKAAFAAEDAFLQEHGGGDGEAHMATHASQAKAFVDLCRKLVPKVKNPKQARQSCLEIFQVVDNGLFHHVTKEVANYKQLAKHHVRQAG
ncbi:MAG: hypothetical protein HY055_18415 [Magnetospirillum sp.]|nr:hypothetical protein [Magnetospirillum sp.]